MQTRMDGVCGRLVDFVVRIANWSWDTCELVFEILLEFFTRAIELVLALLQLIFQVICFLRDMCIDAMQTFANVFRAFVNLVSSFKCEDVEDFVSACMVVGLCFGAVKLTIGILEKRTEPFPNPFRLLRPAYDCPLTPAGKIPPTGVKSPIRKRVSIQSRKGVCGRRPARSSISSSSSASYDVGD